MKLPPNLPVSFKNYNKLSVSQQIILDTFHTLNNMNTTIHPNKIQKISNNIFTFSFTVLKTAAIGIPYLGRFGTIKILMNTHSPAPKKSKLGTNLRSSILSCDCSNCEQSCITCGLPCPAGQGPVGVCGFGLSTVSCQYLPPSDYQTSLIKSNANTEVITTQMKKGSKYIIYVNTVN